MKKYCLILLLCGLAFSCKKNDPPADSAPPQSDYNPGAGWKLAWSEEFNDNTLNTSTWNYEQGTGAWGWGNNELQYYRSDNVKVADGNLVITAQKENYASSSFTSGRITTQNKYSFKYGKIVGKIKLPEGYGIWPAFWMLGSSPQPWPSCGEIDIMELRGGDDKITHSTCHWSNGSGAHQYYGRSYEHTAKLSQGYHYYEVEWNATSIVSRFNGIQFYEMSITAPEVSELRDNNFFIILNMAVGGNFFSPSITDPASVTATFPQSMYVDWIRVYQN